MSKDEKFEGLIAEQLSAQLPSGVVIGRQIIVLEQTDSTNDAIMRVASTDGLPSIPEGLVVFTGHQTDGRGQRGNRWESAAGKGLWFSILLRPQIQLRDSGRLTIWGIEAVSEVICATFDLAPTIKLPNDVQLHGCKVSGVLVEMRAQEKAPHLAVVGIGINVNQCRDDFPANLQDRAISLAMALGRQVDRQSFAVALLRKLDLTYRENFSKAESGLSPSSAPTTTRDKHAAKFRMA